MTGYVGIGVHPIIPLKYLISLISHYLQSFIHRRWLFGNSSINRMIGGKLDSELRKWMRQRQPHGLFMCDRTKKHDLLICTKDPVLWELHYLVSRWSRTKKGFRFIHKSLETLPSESSYSNTPWDWTCEICKKKQFSYILILTHPCTLPKTSLAPENRPKHPKRKFIFQPYIFRCKLAVSFSEGICQSQICWYFQRTVSTSRATKLRTGCCNMARAYALASARKKTSPYEPGSKVAFFLGWETSHL